MTTLIVQPPESPTPHRFTRDQYYQMADLGFFEGRRVELINGEIVTMAPQRNPHYLALNRTAQALAAAFGSEYWVRSQGPLHLAADSEPEPDVAVVPGPMESYKEHPTTALLVVEVSDSTPQFDRGVKGPLYARAGIRDYWIVNVRQNRLEVMRDPVEDPASASGYRYGTTITLERTQGIAPLALPNMELLVADLLP